MQKNYKREIEAILFYRGEEVSLKDISSILDVKEDLLEDSIKELFNELSDRGIVLLRRDGYLSLATNPDLSPIIEKIVKDDLNRDLSSASLETLAIVVYKHPVTKKEIEYIRGVNSSFSIRNLLIRGLIERESSKLDERIYLYRPTVDLMKYLGIKSFDELAEFKEIREQINGNIENIKKDNAND